MLIVRAILILTGILKNIYIFCYIISRYGPIGQRETFNFFTSGLIFRKRTFGQKIVKCSSNQECRSICVDTV